MAVNHPPATIVPRKLDLLQAWVPHQSWLGGTDASTLTSLGSYRFDDPDGEVGVETHLLATADGEVLQVPLTYRGAPRAAASDSLITTMTHTVLGDRWVYDACHDPVYVTALITTIVTGTRQADLYSTVEHGLVLQPATTRVRGSGSSITVQTSSAPVVSHDGTTTGIDVGIKLTLARVIDTTAPAAGHSLSGTWPGQATPCVLATLDVPS